MNLESHTKGEPCYNRPPYRDGKKKTVIKSYSVSQESTYLILFGVPSLHLRKNLKTKCKEYGKVEKFFQITEHENIERFTEGFVVKYSDLSESRYSKRKLDELSFFGSVLHVVFAPELESVAECRLKLHERRCQARRHLKSEPHFVTRSETVVATNDVSMPSNAMSTDITANPDCSKHMTHLIDPLNVGAEVIQQAYCIQSSSTNNPSQNSNHISPMNHLIPGRVIQNLKRRNLSNHSASFSKKPKT